MTKRKILTKFIIAAVLAVTALLLVACRPTVPDPEPINKHNVPASHFYVLSVTDKRLYRCDFNEFGRPLGMIAVDWYTLQPTRYFGSDRDSIYEYDENGRLIGHTYFGAKMELEFDERGYPVRSFGYADLGASYKITYECDDAGRIRRETVVRTNGMVIWEYDEQGRLVREGEDVAYTYDADQITLSLTYDRTPTEVVLTLNETGDISKFDMTVDYRKPKREWYEWTYDENGRCVSSEGTTLDRFYDSFVDTCTITYDEAGRIVSAVTDMDSSLSEPTNEIRREWEYDASGAIVKTVDYTGKQNNTATRGTTYFQDGIRCDRYFEGLSIKDGVETVTRHTDYEYDAQTGYMLSSRTMYHKADGTLMLDSESFYEYDEKWRPTAYIYKQYNDGEPYTEEHTYTRYGEGNEVVQIVTEEIDHRYPSRIVTTTDYEAKRKVKLTRETFAPDRMSDMELRRALVIQVYDDEGQVVTYDYYTYRGDTMDTLNELIRERHERNDYTEGNGWEKTEQIKTYEGGKLVSDTFKTFDEQGMIDYEQTDYQNGIKSAYTEGDYEDKIRIDKNGEATTYHVNGRPVTYTTAFYDADGDVTHVEHWEYQYHDNYYTARIACKTCDKDGNLLSQITKTYDEEGNLLADETA